MSTNRYDLNVGLWYVVPMTVPESKVPDDPLPFSFEESFSHHSLIWYGLIIAEFAVATLL